MSRIRLSAVGGGEIREHDDRPLLRSADLEDRVDAVAAARDANLGARPRLSPFRSPLEMARPRTRSPIRGAHASSNAASRCSP